MNPNPEQPDAPPFVIDIEGELLIIRETRSLFYVAAFNNLRHGERALITCAALNAAAALHATGWDAARVFERLPEALRLAELCVRAQENIESLWNSEKRDDPHSLRDLSDKESERVDAIAALKSFLAQLKLKRDTAGGGR